MKKINFILIFLLEVISILPCKSADIFSRHYTGIMNHQMVEVFLTKNKMEDTTVSGFCFFQDATAPLYFSGSLQHPPQKGFKYVLYEYSGRNSAAQLLLDDINKAVVTGIFVSSNGNPTPLEWRQEMLTTLLSYSVEATTTFASQLGTNCPFKMEFDWVASNAPSRNSKHSLDSLLKNYLIREADFPFIDVDYPQLAPHQFHKMTLNLRDSMLEYLQQDSQVYLKYYFAPVWENKHWLTLQYISYSKLSNRIIEVEFKPVNIFLDKMTEIRLADVFKASQLPQLNQLIGNKYLSREDKNLFAADRLNGELYESFWLTEKGIFFHIPTRAYRMDFSAHIFLTYQELLPFLKDDFFIKWVTLGK